MSIKSYKELIPSGYANKFFTQTDARVVWLKSLITSCGITEKTQPIFRWIELLYQHKRPTFHHLVEHSPLLTQLAPLFSRFPNRVFGKLFTQSDETLFLLETHLSTICSYIGQEGMTQEEKVKGIEILITLASKDPTNFRSLMEIKKPMIFRRFISHALQLGSEEVVEALFQLYDEEKFNANIDENLKQLNIPFSKAFQAAFSKQMWKMVRLLFFAFHPHTLDQIRGHLGDSCRWILSYRSKIEGLFQARQDKEHYFLANLLAVGSKEKVGALISIFTGENLPDQMKILFPLSPHFVQQFQELEQLIPEYIHEVAIAFCCRIDGEVAAHVIKNATTLIGWVRQRQIEVNQFLGRSEEPGDAMMGLLKAKSEK